MGCSRTAYIPTSFLFFWSRLLGNFFFAVGGLWVGKCLSVRRTGGSVFEGLPPLDNFLSIAYFSKSPWMTVCLNCRRLHFSSPLFSYTIWAFTRVMSIKWKNSFLYHLTLFLRHSYGFIFWSNLSTPPIFALYWITASGFFTTSFVFLSIFPVSYILPLWIVNSTATSFLSRRLIAE